MAESRVTGSAAGLAGCDCRSAGGDRPVAVFTRDDLLPGGELEDGPGSAFAVMLDPQAGSVTPSIPCLVLEPSSPILPPVMAGGCRCAADVLLRQAAMGLLLPFILHNLNNRLVGVVGNLDLAGIFTGQPEKVSARVQDARTAMDTVRSYLDDLGRLSDSASPASPPPNLASALDAALRMASAGRGRAVAVESDRSEASAGVRFPAELVPACCGLVCSAMISMAGSGSLFIGAGKASCGKGFGMNWSRSSSGHAPGSSSYAGDLLIASAVSAVGKGAFVRLAPWGDSSGEAEIALPPAGGVE